MSYIPPILTGSLPIPLPGPHPVGYATLRHSPRYAYTLSSPLLPGTSPQGSTNNNEDEQGPRVPALGMRQVEYAVYYPCKSPGSSRFGGWFGGQRGRQGGSVSWLPRPIDFVLDGWRRFANDHPLMRAAAPIIKFTGGRLTAPLLPLAPLLPSSDPTTTPPLPLIIFSHGLAGTKNAYSAVCSALASEGNVVLAIAHGDGSGPGVILHPSPTGSDRDGGGGGGGAGEEIRLGYLKFAELDWSPDRTPDVMHLRSLQLDIRVAEVYETYASFTQLVRSGSQHGLPSFHLYTDDGPPPALPRSSSGDPSSAWLDSWRGRVKTDEVSLVGHSFGGGTLLHLLSNSPPKGFERLPVKRAVALDPWVDPLPMPGPPKSMQEAPPRVPIFAINSEGFTLWKTHFTRLSGMLRKTGGSWVSIIGCDHQTFSDFPLLLTAPSATKLITKINSLVHSFLHDRLADDPEVRGKTPDHGNIRTKRNEKGKVGMEGAWGDVVVHELGE